MVEQPRDGKGHSERKQHHPAEEYEFHVLAPQPGNATTRRQKSSAPTHSAQTAKKLKEYQWARLLIMAGPIPP